MIPPKFRNSEERRVWLEANVANPAWVPAGYDPEPWDVVKDGTTLVVRAVHHSAAEEACLFLNQNNRPHEYEMVLSKT